MQGVTGAGKADHDGVVIGIVAEPKPMQMKSWPPLGCRECFLLIVPRVHVRGFCVGGASGAARTSSGVRGGSDQLVERVEPP